MYKGTLVSLKKEGNSDTCYNEDGCGNMTPNEGSQTQKQTDCGSIYTKRPEEGTEGRTSGCQGTEDGKGE